MSLSLYLYLSLAFTLALILSTLLSGEGAVIAAASADKVEAVNRRIKP